MMEKAVLFDAVAAQRHRLIRILEDLSDEQWNMQSSCAKWRVRDVDWSAGDGALVSEPAGAILLRSPTGLSHSAS